MNRRQTHNKLLCWIFLDDKINFRKYNIHVLKSLEIVVRDLLNSMYSFRFKMSVVLANCTHIKE